MPPAGGMIRVPILRMAVFEELHVHGGSRGAVGRRLR